MALRYQPKVGEVVECDFGQFPDPPITPPANGRIPNEMRKRRLALVLNGRLPNGCALVVPLSSSHNADAVTRGFHVLLPAALVPVTHAYDPRDRWAIAECITHVARARLHPLRDRNGPLTVYLPRDVVADIQRAVLRSCSGLSLLVANEAAQPAEAVSA
ncbi:PemK-like protein [compost metagenome]